MYKIWNFSWHGLQQVEWPNDIVLDNAINQYLALLRKEETFLFNKKSTANVLFHWTH